MRTGTRIGTPRAAAARGVPPVCHQGDPSCNMRQGCSCTPELHRETMQRIAAGKTRSRLTLMTCGHYADYRSDQFFGFAKPAGSHAHWCDACGTWRARTRPARTEYPDEPLF